MSYENENNDRNNNHDGNHGHQDHENHDGHNDSFDEIIDAIPNPWMTTRECAVELSTTPQTVRRMLRDDQVPVLRLLSQIKVRRSDWENMLSSHMGPLL